MDKHLVRDWMTRDPVSIHPQQTLPQAHSLMKSKKVRRLPVMDGETLVGIVTFGDIREAQPSDASSLGVYEMNYLIALLTVDSIMTPDPMTIQEDETIGEAAKLMLEHKIGGLPVVDADDMLVGIITESDICRLVVEAYSD